MSERIKNMTKEQKRALVKGRHNIKGNSKETTRKKMDEAEMIYHMDHLLACDPDYVVDVLDISTGELVGLFLDRARAFIEEEHG